MMPIVRHRTNGAASYIMSEINPGDRVQLTQLGELRNPRKSSKVGTLLAHRPHKSGAASVVILFDGLKEPCRLHKTYIERIEHQAKGQV
jgi:hypothetical protein